MTARPALILQHGDWGPPGLLAEWADKRAIPYEVHRVDQDPRGIPAAQDFGFIAVLGSDRSPRDRGAAPEVDAELTWLADAVAREVPVLGLCYGGQALAAVLGAEVEPAPQPELGWCTVETDVPELVPPGPWLTWHHDRFSLPPGAVALARSPRALQAFAAGPHLGVQFHPESTVEIVREWARLDGEPPPEAPPDHGAGARRRAFQLFDAFLARAYGNERSAA